MNEFGYFVDFVREHYSTNGEILLHSPSFTGNESSFVQHSIRTRSVSSSGQYIQQAEKQINILTGAKSSALLVNGTSALHLALHQAGVRAGDEVITQALTFVATANSIHYNGAEPVFIDVDMDTMGLSPVALKEFLEKNAEIRDGKPINKSSGKRIAACLPMHTLGFMCRIDEIANICQQWNIPLIEDAAEAFGSKFEEKYSGTFGDAGIYSFNGNKVVTAGGGGAVVSMNDHFIQRVKHLAATAKVSEIREYMHNEVGFNFKLPNLNAALLSGQLECLKEIIGNKKRLFEKYLNLADGYGLKIKPIPETTDWNYWMFSLVFEDFETKELFMNETNENGVETKPIWKLMFKLPMFAHCFRDDQRNASILEETIVNIPSSAVAF